MNRKVILCMVLGLSAIVVHAQNGPPASAEVSAGRPITVSPQPPSAAFLADVDAYIALVGQVQALQAKLKATKEWRAYQDASDRPTGMQLRIQQQVPRGWTYDSKSRMFVPIPAPPAPARPTPAAPAPKDVK